MFALFSAHLTAQVICPAPTVLESTVLEWDWRMPTYTMYYKIANGQSITDPNMASPFLDDSANGSPNVQHLQLSAPDYEPNEAWELLYKNFGGIRDNGTTEFIDAPSFALYNRHTGQVRSFLFHPTDNSSSFDIIRMTAGHVPATRPGDITGNEDGSALFSLLTVPSLALDRFNGLGDQPATLNRYVDGGVWSISEFVAAYDPCVCQADSRLYFEALLQGNQDINLTITGTSYTTPVVSNGSPASALQKGYSLASNGFSAVSGGLMAWDKLSGYYGTVSDWEAAGGGTTGTDRPILDIAGDILPGWLSVGSSVVKLLKFFTGKKGEEEKAKVVGYSSEFNLEAAGTLEVEDYANPAIIFSPSARAQTSGEFQDGSVPTYQNPLGVFNLVVTPRVRTFRNSNAQAMGRIEDTYHALDLRTFQYVVNTSAGFEETPRDIKLSLIFGDCVGSPYNMNLLTAQQGGSVRTPFIDAACFGEQYFNFYSDWKGDAGQDGGSTTGDPSSPEDNDPLDGGGIKLTDLREYNCQEVTLEVMVTLIPTDGSEDVLFMANYVVSFDFQGTPISGPIEDLGGRYDSNTGCNLPVPLPVTAQRLTRFCEEQYDPTRVSPASARVELVVTDAGSVETRGPEETVLVYPNPFSELLTVSSQGDDPVRSFVLTSIDGRVVLSHDNVNGNLHTVRADASALPPGLYIITIDFDSGNVSKAVIKK